MHDHTDEELTAARQAAQRVVDSANSWESTAEQATIAEALRQGLDEASVDVEPEEFERLVAEIDESGKDEGHPAPEVRAAFPV